MNDINNTHSAASVCINIHASLKPPRKLHSAMSDYFTTPRKLKKKMNFGILYMFSTL